MRWLARRQGMWGGISHFLAGLGTVAEAAQDAFLVFVEGFVHGVISRVRSSVVFHC